MKISQEARESARIIMDSYPDAFPIWLGRAIKAGGDDGHPLLVYLQSLINSTLERSAAVADNHADMNAGSNDDYVNGIECGCMSVAEAIRQLIEE